MRRSLVVAVVLALALAACDTTPPDGPHVLFSKDPASNDNPFPDLRLLKDGKGLDLSARPKFYVPFLPAKTLTKDVTDFFAGYGPSFAELKGFGNLAGVLVRFSDEVDATTLDGRFVYLETTAAGFLAPGPKAIVELATEPLLTAGAAKALRDEKKFFALVRPERPLRPGGRAVLAMLAGAKTKDGSALVRAPDFHEWAENEGAALVSIVATANGGKSSDIVFAMELRPTDVTAELRSIAEWAKKDAAVDYTIPKQSNDSFPRGRFAVPTDDLAYVYKAWIRQAPEKEFDAVGSVTTGTFQSHELRGDDGVFKPEFIANPDASPTAALDFVLTLPKGERPAGGWPVMIGGHGLGGRNSLAAGSDDSFCIRLAQTLAKKGFGCIGLDAASHGNRGNIAGFFALSDLRKPRDNFRQTAADMLQLARLVRVIDVDGDGKPDLDPSPRYVGHSMGAIMGTTFTAISGVNEAVLNSPGGGLTGILLSAAIQDQVGIILSAETGIEYQSDGYYAAFPLFRALGQLVIEPGDPIHYAPLLSGKRVLIQEGLGDRTVPNFTTEALAAAGGLSLVQSELKSDAGVSGRYVFDPAKYNLTDPTFDPHNSIWKIADVRTQLQTFFSSGGTDIPVY